jgi:threonine synthase
MAAHFIVECLDCGYSTPYFPTSVSCPRCGSGWREALYDYQSLGLTLPLQLPGRPFDIWRYKELLPVRDHNPDNSLGEGGTPMIKATAFGNMVQCPNLFIKDERQNPTGSFEDRQAAVTIAALQESAVNEMVVVSTGNIALSYAAYTARTGIKLWAFLPSRTPPSKIREISLFGARVIKVTGNYEQTKQVALDFARQRNIFLDQIAQTVPSVEAMKTLAFEITEQLTAHMGSPLSKTKNKPGAPWRAPDWFIQPVSLGLGPIGALKGFSELRVMGLIDHAPAMGMIQPEGCSPMVRAWNQGLDLADPFYNQDTSIDSMAVIDPGRAYTLLNHRMEQESGGVFETVTDRESNKAISLLARMEGISVEPAAGIAFAGLIKLCNRGIIKEKDIVVVNCTGHTSSMEKINRLNTLVRKKMTASLLFSNTDNLVSALNQIDFQETPRILIAVSDENTRRIIQLFALLQGAAEIYDAADQQKIIQVVQTTPPDLIILDLTASEFNGFTILDALFSGDNQNQIPIIGMINPELTDLEKLQLCAQVEQINKRREHLNTGTLDDLKLLIQPEPPQVPA